MMKMKGYLKTSEGLFQLSPKVTTIGREGCDLVIQSPNVDQQHAVIEYSDQEDCYVLQDLNTATGTYVNDCRVQNAAVRLAPRDIIRFGFGGIPYELDIDNTQQQFCVEEQYQYPPVQQRPAWTQPITVLQDSGQYTTTPNNTGLPYLSTGQSVPTSAWTPQTMSTPIPHPPTSVRQRPLSAGAKRPSYENLQRIGSAATPPKGSSPVQQRGVTGGGWIGTPSRPASRSAGSSPTHDILMMQDKEQKIMRMGDEINRLAAFEADAQRKDQIIQQLQEEINRLRQMHAGTGGVYGTDAELTQKLLALENEVSSKKIEVSALREQLARLQQESATRSSPAATQQEMHNMKNELDRVKKDKNITSGLVTQMQRDLSNKDSTISRLTRENEGLKRDIRAKEVELSAMQAKVARLRDTKRSDEERDSRDKELASLRQKFKTAENKIQDQNDLICSIKDELEKTKVSLTSEQEASKKLKSELDQAKSQFLDMQRTERLVRVDLEQASKRLERFRSRVIQVTFSTPGIRAPDSEISDDQLIETLKKVVDQRTEFSRKLVDLKESLKLANSTKRDASESVKKLKDSLNDAESHFRENGRRVVVLKQQIGLLQSVSVDDSLQWMKDRVIGLLSGELAWEQDVENALERCGVNVKVSTDEPGRHITALSSKWESAISAKDKLTAQLSLVEQKHKAELTEQLSKMKNEMTDKLNDAVEKAKLEGEEKMNRAIDEIRAVEAEKRENAMESEKKKQTELEARIEELRANLTAKAEEDRETLESAKLALEQVEDYKKIEAELREELEKLKADKQAELESLKLEKDDLSKGSNKEIESYKEQIKQHSVTICAMEERLNKTMKKNKDYQAEITQLKQTIQEKQQVIQELKLKPKPAPPAKAPQIIQKPAQVVVQKSQDVYALEQIVLALRRESQDYKAKLQEQQDVILGLRRDLAGASARLSDMTGELSEAQKEELEQNKLLVRQREKELEESRQQMAKLSTIIDKKTQEIKDYSAELSKLKTELKKFKNITNDKENQLMHLQEELKSSLDDQQKQMTMLQEEGQITTELSALGAQCRGERHEQVIARQREALAELRNRIKGLEQVRPAAMGGGNTSFSYAQPNQTQNRSVALTNGPQGNAVHHGRSNNFTSGASGPNGVSTGNGRGRVFVGGVAEHLSSVAPNSSSTVLPNFSVTNTPSGFTAPSPSYAGGHTQAARSNGFASQPASFAQNINNGFSSQPRRGSSAQPNSGFHSDPAGSASSSALHAFEDGSVPSHDQALQQIALLKKELAEMRANQALSENQTISAVTSLDREISKVRGQASVANADADIERSAHRETMSALDDSESSYLTLLRAIASCLEMEEVSGLRSVAHIPKDERIRLCQEREKTCELVASRIKVLRERIARKDELLETYERDLNRLRQAEQLAEKKHAQVESLATDVRSKIDETQYLRESLNRTRDRLEQEKRLNSAIKQRKTFHMENEKPAPNYGKHQCPPEDIFGKASAKTKAQKEKLRRKSYEVKTLKNELYSKDVELHQASKRITNLETSLGLDTDPHIYD